MPELTFMEATREVLGAEMARDPMIFVVGEGIAERGGNYNTTIGLYERFGPWRLRDTPICERGFTTLCTGAAMLGARPVVDFMILDFLFDAMGDLVNQTAKIQWMSEGRIKMPIVLRGCIGVAATAAHHSSDGFPFFVHAPGFRVVVPVTPADAKGLFTTALRSDDPVIFLEHKKLIHRRGDVPEGDYAIPFGRAAVAREGADVTLVAISYMVVEALQAAEALAAEGISVEVVDPRTLAPLDVETIVASVAKTHRLLVVDEDYGPCGAAGEIAMRVMEEAFFELDDPIARLTGRSLPAPYSPPLEAAVVPNAQTIAEAVRKLLRE
jgi:2-oxoisovalerate dehydrogenase E1 component